MLSFAPHLLCWAQMAFGAPAVSSSGYEEG
jgi:hypothetical protein